MKQKLSGNKKFPLLVELEPLFACNLACNGCGKIQHPANILKQRMSVEQAVGAIEEANAPMVSIAGGEPLIHPEIHVIADELVKRKRFVYLCTNALLLEKKLDKQRELLIARQLLLHQVGPDAQADAKWHGHLAPYLPRQAELY